MCITVDAVIVERQDESLYHLICQDLLLRTRHKNSTQSVIENDLQRGFQDKTKMARAVCIAVQKVLNCLSNF